MASGVAQRLTTTVAALLLGTMLLTSCGSGPTAPVVRDGGILTPPMSIGVTGHRLELLSNRIDLAWSGSNATDYRVYIGSTPQANDLKVVDVTGMSYTFIAPRTANTYFARVAARDGSQIGAPSAETSFTTADVRHIVDALFFKSGPMSEAHAIQLGTMPASVWPVGTRLRVVVSPEAGERVRALAQAAMDDYASLTQQSVTGTAELVADDMRALTTADLPRYTIAIRVLAGFCSARAAACASFGPAPLGRDASLITLQTATVTGVTVTHEMGHAYGLSHIFGETAILRFLMGPSAGSATFSSGERDAIASAFAGGLRAGTTRDMALAAGLVLPYDGFSVR
ncbi:MAG: fibronectin type III domain-containing protein [Acidobacteria bacterium]|nr:fibronectin type III domain-containing protein [Acidobacteriota bacterium]